MSLKGQIASGHIPKNKYQLQIIGLPVITFTSVGSLEEEIEKVDLPDRTAASGGQKKALTTTVKVPSHHTIQILAMEAWFKSGQDPVAPTYKKSGVLVQRTIHSAASRRTYMLSGVWCMKRTTPELSLANEGEQSEVEYQLSIDQITLAV